MPFENRAGGTPAPTVMPARVPWSAVGAYVVIAFGLAWLVAAPMWLSGRGLATPGAFLCTAVMMYTPAAAALIVVFFLQRPRPARIAEYLGLWPIRPVARTFWLIVAGSLGSILLVFAGVALAWAFGFIQLDLVHFSGFARSLETLAPGTAAPPIGLLVALQFATIPFAAVANGFATVGEELGWRGWLLPSLRPLGTWPALAITGAVWGLWHAPLILLGYDFARPDALGLAAMVGACVLYGILVGWLRLRSASLWPSVFAHGALNATAGIAGVLVLAGTRPDPLFVGGLGILTWIVMALVIVVLAASGQFRRQPTLARRAAQGARSAWAARRR